MTRDSNVGNRSHRSAVVLALGALVAGLLVGAPADAAPALRAADPDDRSGGVVSHSLAASVVQARSVRDFWTPERMAAARPLDLLAPAPGPSELRTGTGGGGGILTQPHDPAEADVVDGLSARRRSRAPRTAGKLFFTDGLLNEYVCSAAAINTRDKNQVITAGHCVNAGDGAGWFQDFVFVPRYHKGRAPDGRWAAKKAWALEGWTEQGRFAYDQAILEFERRKGRKLVEAVGGNGVAWGRGVRQRGVHVWGWPAEDPYTGEVAKRCEGRTTRFRESADAKIRCRMTGGSSGGPWLLKQGRTANAGYVWAVTSRRTTSGTKYLLARPNGKGVKRLIRRAN